MDIKEWLHKNNKDQLWLANKLSVSTSRLSRVISGELNIRLSEALKIEDLTNGKIKPKYWLGVSK